MQNMQNAESGVPVKTVKNFSTSIPGAFTGKIDYCCSLLFVVFLEAICLAVSFATLVNFLVKALDACNSHWISLSCRNSACQQLLSLASLCTIASLWSFTVSVSSVRISVASFPCILMSREFFTPEKIKFYVILNKNCISNLWFWQICCVTGMFVPVEQQVS